MRNLPAKRLLWNAVCGLLAALCAVAAVAEPPVIGLIYPKEHFQSLTKKKEDKFAAYRSAIEAHGGTVAVIAQGMPEETLSETLERLDGVLLPGGIDVEPARYREPPHPKLGKTDPELDALEFRALEHAKRRALPVLGICRGHQVLNVFYGGTLIQDIPSLRPSARLVAHRDKDARHTIAIGENTLLRAIIGDDHVEVNSLHHQAVKDVAPGFIASAHSADGIIEAIESTGDVFLVGVQFHPEKIRAQSPPLDALFVRFLEASCREPALDSPQDGLETHAPAALGTGRASR